MTNKEKAKQIADAILAPVPEGIGIVPHSSCYLIPANWINAGSNYTFSGETPVYVCAGGKAVLSLVGTKEKAVEAVNSWLNSIGPVGWSEHAAKYFEVEPEVMRNIGSRFSHLKSFEKVAEELRTKPELFFNAEE